MAYSGSISPSDEAKPKYLTLPFLLTKILGHFKFFSKPMTKGDLIAVIAAEAGITKKSAGDALQAFIDAITAELKKGESVTVTGFGTFKISHRAARTGVNPRNPSEKIKIPAMNLPTFKAGKALKSSVR